ncbi:MAG TPA: hypothetical protein VJL89_00680 [Thermodesulfovibrionia bacterium]|nr:hypothetical protein [Thermodesulfovibrionia bacterium]
MTTLEEYIKPSDEFLLFIDETLYQHACHAVEEFLLNYEPVNKRQLYSIPAVIEAQGRSGLEDLIKNQREKNTKEKNKLFWEFLFEIISKSSTFSLTNLLVSELNKKSFLKDEETVTDKVQKKRIRKDNNAIIDKVIDKVLPVYFEHFNCHYFYKTSKELYHET